ALEHEPVAAVAACQEIIAAAAVEDVVAVFAVHRVVAVARAEERGSRARRADRHIGEVAEQDVVAHAAVQLIAVAAAYADVLATFNAVAAFAAEDDQRSSTGGSGGVDAVVPRFGIEREEAVARAQRHRDVVVAGAGGQRSNGVEVGTAHYAADRHDIASAAKE